MLLSLILLLVFFDGFSQEKYLEKFSKYKEKTYTYHQLKDEESLQAFSCKLSHILHVSYTRMTGSQRIWLRTDGRTYHIYDRTYHVCLRTYYMVPRYIHVPKRVIES